ncbi:adenylate/guanylate cyclase domain-containing protein [Nannocystis pusilla]|uniref:adenylate/guanylate cyclase domain-containing protein n=1 Tax=Nannocystis pusilla TaxID=889268 RepID=UPI003DA2BC74
MGADLYRVKVVSKRATTAVFDVKVIHPDISTIPEDRSFALMLLREASDHSLLAREVTTADMKDKAWLKKYASGFIRSVELTATGRSAKRGRLTVTVSDPAWLDHVQPGESFDTAAFKRLDKYDKHPPILLTKGAAESPEVDGAALDGGFLWVPREAFGDVSSVKPLPPFVEVPAYSLSAYEVVDEMSGKLAARRLQAWHGKAVRVMVSGRPQGGALGLLKGSADKFALLSLQGWGWSKVEAIGRLRLKPGRRGTKASYAEVLEGVRTSATLVKKRRDTLELTCRLPPDGRKVPFVSESDVLALLARPLGFEFFKQGFKTKAPLGDALTRDLREQSLGTDEELYPAVARAYVASFTVEGATKPKKKLTPAALDALTPPAALAALSAAWPTFTLRIQVTDPKWIAHVDDELPMFADDTVLAKPAPLAKKGAATKKAAKAKRKAEAPSKPAPKRVVLLAQEGHERQGVDRLTGRRDLEGTVRAARAAGPPREGLRAGLRREGERRLHQGRGGEEARRLPARADVRRRGRAAVEAPRARVRRHVGRARRDPRRPACIGRHPLRDRFQGRRHHRRRPLPGHGSLLQAAHDRGARRGRRVTAGGRGRPARDEPQAGEERDDDHGERQAPLIRGRPRARTPRARATLRGRARAERQPRALLPKRLACIGAAPGRTVAVGCGAMAFRTGETSLSALAAARARHHEQQVLAARAIEGERWVAAVRLVALAFMAISQGVIGKVTGTLAGAGERPVIIAVYATFTVVAFFIVRRAPVNLTRARIMPLLATVLDVGFVVAMDYVDYLDGRVEVERTIVLLPLIISYSLLRYGGESLVFSTALAVAAATATLLWAGTFTWAKATFVAVVLVALALLLAGTRRAIRQVLIDLKRREELSRLVAPKVVDEILAGREDRLRPARREVTLLFADIRGFTGYSEARSPEEVLRLLDDYYGRMTQVVQGHEGSVNKFLGDGLLALWGAPDPQPDHPVRAVRAALAMHRVVAEMSSARVAAGEPPLQVGIGVHTGEVAVGVLGGGGQSEYAVLGDAVNLASRIEGLTKQLGADMLVSEATWSRLGGAFVGRSLGEVAVAGRRAPVELHALASPDA